MFYAIFPLIITLMLTMFTIYPIIKITNLNLNNSIFASSWIFSTIVLLGQLKIARVESANLYYKIIATKATLELLLYSIIIIFSDLINLGIEIVFGIETVLSLILANVIYVRYHVPGKALQMGLKNIIYEFRQAFYVAIGLLLASLSYQFDRLFLIKLLPAESYDTYIFASLFKNIGMSAGAVLASFAYPHFSKLRNENRNEYDRLLRKSMLYFVSSMPVAILLGFLGISSYIDIFKAGVNMEFSDLLAVSIMASMFLNVAPEVRILIDGGYKLIIVAGCVGIASQSLGFAALWFNESLNLTSSLWVVAGSYVLQSIYLMQRSLRFSKD
jgi:O-antigen/teichoic acid export membrane protein